MATRPLFVTVRRRGTERNPSELGPTASGLYRFRGTWGESFPPQGGCGSEACRAKAHCRVLWARGSPLSRPAAPYLDVLIRGLRPERRA
jgi:hypothetical protein